jgi:hypothetical protein
MRRDKRSSEDYEDGFIQGRISILNKKRARFSVTIAGEF